MSKNIYTSNYRKIWSDINGPIPKDHENRSYEIHHIDSNKSNNIISNLVCVSIQEHYYIHLSQNDYGACLSMQKRMKLSPKEISNIATLHNFKRVKKGIHPFQNKLDDSNNAKNQVKKRNQSISN